MPIHGKAMLNKEVLEAAYHDAIIKEDDQASECKNSPIKNVRIDTRMLFKVIPRNMSVSFIDL